MSSKAMSLKGRINHYAKQNGLAAQVVLQNFMFERFLERLSRSEYRQKFVIKGGMLVTAIVGIDTRTTMDLDTTLRNLPLTEPQIREAITAICNIPVDDDVSFQIVSIEPIRKDDTLSLLAGLDLVTGEAIPLVRETHKSSDFIEFLKILDSKYPKGDKIRLVLDNHSAHTSKETRAFLATIPGRFEFVFTPKHGSWLNMIEGFFGKMTNQMLRGIRVQSKEELADRIYKYFDEVNATPVVHHWKYKMDEIDPEEKVSVGLAI